MTSPEQLLAELCDRRAIEELVARYSRTLDWLDEEGQAGCYWPDAAIDYGFFTGTAADFVPVVMAIERRSERRWHLLSGLALRFISADAAAGECYGIAMGARRDEAGGLSGTIYGGRYLDTYAKRKGEWRIASRRYVMDWSLPLPDQPEGSPNPEFPLPILAISQPGHPLYRPM